MTDLTEDGRREFKAWAEHCGLYQKTHGPIGNRTYDSSYTTEHWQTWQAAWTARAARERELREAANMLIDYIEAHGWGSIPEPYDSINPLLKLLGRAALSETQPEEKK